MWAIRYEVNALQSTPNQPRSEAERIFAEAIGSLDIHEDPDIDALCQSHPREEKELRWLYQEWIRLRGLVDLLGLNESFSERIRSRDESKTDPRNSLDKLDKAEPSCEEFSSEILNRLSKRHGAFGRYNLKGEIARGGQGAILRVWDEDLRRTLAMKVILGRGESEEKGKTPPIDSKTLGRFLEEAQVTGQLDHPGIVPVHELGLDSEGRVYFTMKLVKGRTLREIFDLVHQGKEGWTVTRALGVMLKVCEAMSYAHSKGVIHRDLKPSNVMVGRFGEVFVMDWGLARVLGEEDRKDIRIKPEMTTSELHSERRERAEETPDSPLITMDGDVVGTPSYMSPEQARGDLENLGPQSDVYSIGTMLYHLLTGQMPYVPPDAKLNNYAVWRSVQEGPPRPVSELVDHAPAELEAICERAMARSPDDRYADVQELSSDLVAFLEGRVVRAFKCGALVELRKFVARNKAAVAAASLVAALMIVVAGLLVTWAGFQEAKVQENLARWEKYVASIRGAAMAVDKGNIAEAEEFLAICPVEYKGWEWGHLSLIEDSSMMTIRSTSEVNKAVFSPDGTMIASAETSGNVSLWDVKTGKSLGVLDGQYGGELGYNIGPDKGALSIAWSTNGKRLACGSADGTLRIWDVQNKTALATSEPQKGGINAVAWSPDATRLLSAGYEPGWRLWAGKGAEELIIAKQGGDFIQAVAWHPEGALFATASVYSLEEVMIWDAITGSLVRQWLTDQVSVNSILWSPAGGQLAGAGSDGTIKIWDAKNGKVLRVIGDRGGAGLLSMAWFPDGKRLATGNTEGAIQIWNISSGRLIAELRGHHAKVSSVDWSPSGARLISGSADRTLRIWDASTRDAVVSFECGDEDIEEEVSFDADGGTALTYDEDRETLVLVDTLTGKVRQRWNLTTKLVGFDLCADGSRIASWDYDGRLLVRDIQMRNVVLEKVFPPVGEEESDNPARLIECNGNGEKVLLTYPGGKLEIWDVDTGRLVADLPGCDADISVLSISHDDSRIASGHVNGDVYVRPMENPENSVPLEGHEGAVTDIAWFPDGNTLVTVGKDATLRKWKPTNGQCLAVLRGRQHDEPHATFDAVAVSPDGQRIVTSESYGKIFLYFNDYGTWSLTTGDDMGEFVVRIWDAESGEKLLAIEKLNQPFGSELAFGAGGLRILAGGSLSKSLQSFESDLGIAREAWRWQELRERALPYVSQLFEEHFFIEEVLSQVRSDVNLDEDLLSVAISLAQIRGGPGPWSLNSLASDVLYTPSPAEDDLEIALRNARRACKRLPGSVPCLCTLGGLLFRLQRFDEAVQVLDQAVTLSRNRRATEKPPIQYFHNIINISTIYVRFGDIEQAKPLLQEAKAFLGDSSNDEVFGRETLLENLSDLETEIEDRGNDEVR